MERNQEHQDRSPLRNPRIVVITGLDGTGKSTLIRNLLARGLDASTATIWDGMKKSPFTDKKAIDSYLSTLGPNSRLLFLAHALLESLDMGRREEKEVLLFNGYYYKYFASELAQGGDPGLTETLSKTFPEPEQVIRLHLPARECFRRKSALTGYECGFREPGEEAFVAFQEKVDRWMKHFTDARWTELSSAESPEILAEHAYKILH